MPPLKSKLQAWVEIPLVRMICSSFDQSPPLLHSESKSGNGGRGSSLAHVHEHHGTTGKRAPALRALLRVAVPVFPGQADGHTDQQRLHAAVPVTPHRSEGFWRQSCPPRNRAPFSCQNCRNS
ncbi:hypothetical protein ILYODFUR_025211 [Ilyodon furcidens]|uniref:Uncharacterized protein n=1 Tax=Ilyodon furcidens TaxID=33524 RepID=A0ABV0TP22_9TELE